MRLHVGLQDLFSYTLLPVYIIIALMLIPLIIWLAKLLIKLLSNIPDNQDQSAEEESQIHKPVRVRDANAIKNKYIRRVDILYKAYNQNKISERDFYGDLSNLIRSFVFEMTGVETHKYTLMEIRQMNMPGLEKMINDYYTPEFARDSHGNPETAALEARKAIERWN